MKVSDSIEKVENQFLLSIFVFKNLHKLSDRPAELAKGIFKRLFEIAEIAKMDRKELAIYQESLKDYWDLKSVMDTYFDE